MGEKRNARNHAVRPSRRALRRRPRTENPQALEAGRIIIMSRHKTRQDLALEYGATDIAAERGDAGVARIKELTAGVGADSVLECVGRTTCAQHDASAA